MNLNFKKGFTLVELLFCITIIAIVSAFGVTIMKESTEKAYERYYFSAFGNLYDAIVEIEHNEYDFQPIKNSDPGDFAAQINKHFNGDASGNTINGTRVSTMNGVSFTFSSYQSLSDTYKIEISVPAPKTRNTPNGTRTVVAYFWNDANNKLLIPSANEGDVRLQNNRELLPTYIERGEGSPVSNHFYSFHDAYCILNNKTDVVLPNGTTILSCSGYTIPSYEVGNTGIGLIRFANPSKVAL